jgi:hypothetical protein
MRVPLLRRRRFSLLLGLFIATLLGGCITLDCKDCEKCDDRPGGEACNWHYATPEEKVTWKCPNGGKICSSGGSCAGTCTTYVEGNTCKCGCR